MNGFIRYTHYKTDDGWKYRNLPEWNNDEFEMDVVYLHALGIEPMTLNDIITEIHKYNEQFPDAPYSDDKNEICRSLVDMLMYDMIRVVEINGK